MTSEDRPPMPATPPPSSEPPEPPAPLPPAPTPTNGPIVDHVPGAAPAPPPGNGPGGLILPSDLPTWAPAAQPGSEAADDDGGDAGDTIPISSFLAQLKAQSEPEADAGETQRAWAGEAPAAPAPVFSAPDFPAPGLPVAPEAPISPPSEFAPPAGFTPPPGQVQPLGYDAQDAPTLFGNQIAGGFTPPPPSDGFAPPPGFVPPPPAGFDGQPPPGPGFAPPAPTGGAHAGGPATGRGKVAALIAGVVVLVVLLAGGGYAAFHSSSKKTPVAAPTPSAAVSAPAAPTAAPTPTVAPTSAAPSPTADANLGGMQAKMLQSTVIAPLKNLITDDLHIANASDHCVGLAANAKTYDAHVAERVNLLAQLRKLDVTAMQDHLTWKGLLEQIQLKNIMFEQQLSAYSKALEKSCNPSTATKNTHYKQAVAIAKASGALQTKFLASFNPVAKRYNIPMQGQGKL